MECGKPRNNRMRCAIAFPCGAHWIDMAGYVASLLVFATFYMKTMIPLRIIAVLSNVAFIVYASSDGLYPILVLHSVLLPLNLSRISQTVELKKLVERATKGDVSVKCLGPFMKPVRWEAGGVIVATARSISSLSSTCIVPGARSKSLSGERQKITPDVCATSSTSIIPMPRPPGCAG
jgi:hypothetical protein